MKFRKKPIIVEAFQWFKEMGSIGGVIYPFSYVRESAKDLRLEVSEEFLKENGFEDSGWIPTLEGGHIVSDGDYIITGVKGEQYPCKPDIFKQTYEQV